MRDLRCDKGWLLAELVEVGFVGGVDEGGAAGVYDGGDEGVKFVYH